MDFYQRPPCGGRLTVAFIEPAVFKISIHVPLAGDDHQMHDARQPTGQISIHVPLAGDDSRGQTSAPLSMEFLSTSPLRGTTQKVRNQESNPLYFYPRPPCGGRRSTDRLFSPVTVFLSTSPLRGTTYLRGSYKHIKTDFYPRPPCGGRHEFQFLSGVFNVISIHVPLAGDDLAIRIFIFELVIFLSTSPLRGTTHPARL